MECIHRILKERRMLGKKASRPLNTDIKLILNQNRILLGSSALQSSEGLLIHESYTASEIKLLVVRGVVCNSGSAWLVHIEAESFRVRDRRAKTSKFICVRQLDFSFEALEPSPNHRIVTTKSSRFLYRISATTRRPSCKLQWW